MTTHFIYFRTFRDGGWHYSHREICTCQRTENHWALDGAR